ncbi:MAG TPA: Ricin and poly(3-hydroxybutyrate) depolymerase fusion [Polyangiaceae bacterium]|nr:Ricin and poly(3-hydroxybutyrate) depolymerase fusion [Polyangiaceae bacterium]
MTLSHRRFYFASLVAVGLPLSCGGSGTTPGTGGSSTGASAGVAQGSGGTTSTGGTGTGGTGTGGTGVSGTGGSVATGGTSASGAGGGSGTGPAGGMGMGRGGRAAGGGGLSNGVGGGSGGTVTGSGGAATSGGAGASGGMPAAGGTSSGCGSSNTTSPCGTKGTMCSIDVSGTTRQYYVQLPKTYDPSTPYRLIFQFHPWGGTADQALTMYGLNSGLPDSIFVTPQGLDAGSNGPGWANTNDEDIAFTKSMLADVQGKYCVDNSRIFSVGFSYGGMMSDAIGCEMSDVFRAIAPMSGALYSDPTCKGTGPHIAMWGSHGTNDTVVPIADGRAARDKILAQNHCGTTTMPVDPSPCVKYEGCDPGYDVTWCEWDGPHGIPSFGSSAITAFLKQF